MLNLNEILAKMSKSKLHAPFLAQSVQLCNIVLAVSLKLIDKTDLKSLWHGTLIMKCCYCVRMLVSFSMSMVCD